MQTEIDSAITPSGTSEEVRSFKNKPGGLLTSNMRTSKELRTDFETYLWGTNIFSGNFYKFGLGHVKSHKSGH